MNEIIDRRRETRQTGIAESEVRRRAFAMPLTSPAYPIGPYRFVNREYFIITYRSFRSWKSSRPVTSSPT